MAPATLRETVLKAAVDYIADNGPDGLSFRQVAVAGVSHQAPYHHFSDRRGIFQAIATDGYAMFTDTMLDALAGEPREPTTRLLEAYVNFALEHRGHFRVMFRPDLCPIADNPELQRLADGSFDVLVDHVRDVLGPKAPLKDIRAQRRCGPWLTVWRRSSSTAHSRPRSAPSPVVGHWCERWPNRPH